MKTETRYDVMCLAETWLKEGQQESVSIQNFTLAASFSRKKKTGGGVAIYVRENTPWTFTRRTDIEAIGEESTFEVSGIEIKGETSTIIVVLYRTPDEKNLDSFFKKLHGLLSRLSKEKKPVSICADLNIDILQENKKKSRLVDILLEFNMKAQIKTPTRVSASSSTAIDNILTNFKLKYDPKIEKTAISDHYGLSFVLQIHETKENVKIPGFYKKRLITTDKLNDFTRDIEIQDWTAVCHGTTVDEKFAAFQEIFNYHFNNNFPKKTLKVGPGKNTPKRTWKITPEIIEASKKKRRLYHLSCKKNGSKHKEELKKARKSLRSLIKAEKRKQNDKSIAEAENKNKALWDIINKCRNKSVLRKPKTIQLVVNGKKILDNQIIANQFNDHFATIAESIVDTQAINIPECMNLIKNACPEYAGPEFTLTPTNEKEIIEIITNLKNKKSTGWDEIPIKVIKCVSTLIAKPMVDICNFSLMTGTFPSAAKWSIIKPLHKKGADTNMDNYRPISLVTNFSKIFEKVFLVRLLNFIKANGILCKNQHGFRKGFSTTTATTCLVETITECLENKKAVGVIFCDLSKAFDTINTRILIIKLNFYGIKGTALKWIKSYLSERKQKVKLNFNDDGSEWIASKHGIPQGTLLAPILFSLYVNDLAYAAKNVNTDVILYADDTSLIVESKNRNDLLANLKSSISKAERWFKPNQLKLNHDKTNIVIFTGKGSASETEVICEGNTIYTKDTCNFLGTTIDHRLIWKTHANNLSSSLSSACFVLSNLTSHVNKITVKIAFHALVQAKIRYGIILWGSSPSAERVFKKQKRALRIIGNLRKRQSCKPLFKELQFLTLTCIYILELVLFVLDNISDFKKNSDIHNFNTRSNYFRKNKTRLNIAEQSPKNIGVHIFNYLPDCIKTLTEKRSVFKEQTKRFLLNHGFYTLDEFLASKDCKCIYCVDFICIN